FVDTSGLAPTGPHLPCAEWPLQVQAEPSQARPGLARTEAAAGIDVATAPCTVSTSGTCSISSYCKGGFEQKTRAHAACLLLGANPSADKDKIRTADRISRLLKHPDTRGSPELAAKISKRLESNSKN
uniref:J domain-containing protein n=1 Tax=Junco hyemalis TaxID=40217 RepID=A0A8C5NQQ4_JUNHY